MKKKMMLVSLLFVFMSFFIGCNLGSSNNDLGSDNNDLGSGDDDINLDANDEKFTLGDKDSKTISGISFNMIYIHPGSFQRDTNPQNISIITKGIGSAKPK